MALKIHPKFRAVTKVQAEPKRGVGRDASPIVDNLGNPVRRNPDGLRKLVLRQTILSKELVFQHCTGLDRCKFVLSHRRLSSVVIHDPNLVRLAIDPSKDHSPLAVDPYRVEFLQVALELLQPVRWRYHQIVKAVCGVDRFELALGFSGDPLELANPLIVEQRICVSVAKRSDHRSSIPNTGMRSTTSLNA